MKKYPAFSSRQLRPPAKPSHVFRACGVIWLACAGLFNPTAASAADITWGAATNITADTDVSTLGTLIGAVNVGDATTVATTVNTVLFNPVVLTGTSVTSGNFTFAGDLLQGAASGGGAVAPFSTLSSGYQTLLSTIGGNASVGLPIPPNPLTVSISGLITGNTYQVQSWYNLSTVAFSFQSTLTTGLTSVTLTENTTTAVGGVGQFATGTFLADGANQDIVYTSTISAGLNGFQLRDITPVAAFWKGDVDGNWNTNVAGDTNWTVSVGGADTGIIPGSLSDVTFSDTGAANQNTTLNADFTIKSLTILDTAAVTIAGLNTLTISGAAGTGLDVQAGAGLLTVDANLTLAGASDTVTVNNTAGAVINGTLASSNGLTKLGTGSLTLTGTNAYAGTTTVTEGALVVNGTQTGGAAVTVASGAMLAGTGALATAVNESMTINGILSVGDPTLAVPVASVFAVSTSGTGSIVMANGSALQVDVLTGAGLGDNTGVVGSSDHLSLTGSMSFAAGSSIVILNPLNLTGFAGGDKWQVVNLNGGAGAITSFAGVVNDSALPLTSTQVGNFDATTGVYQIIDVQGGLAMAGAQDQILLNGIQGALGDINGHLFMLRAGKGYDEDENSIADAADGDVVLGQGDGPEDKNPIAKRVLRSYQWEVFTTVNYANLNLSNIGTQAGVQSHTWAPSVGIERHVSPHLTVGLAVSLLETHQTYTNGLGTLDMEGVALSAYVSYVRKALWMDLLYSFGRFDLDTDRNATGFPLAMGSTTAYTNAVQFNTGWNFRFQNNKLVTGPFLGVDYLNVAVDGYNESGGGIGALTYNSRSLNSLVTRVGWSLSRKFESDIGTITPQIRLSYERQNLTSNTGTSVNLINQPFTATNNSQRPGQDYMVAGAGVKFQFTPELSLLLNYQAQLFRQNFDAHYFGVIVGYKF